jgi:hypothetical protein
MGRVRSFWMLPGTLLALAALLSALAGCGGKTASVAPKTLTIAPSVLSLEQGTSANLTVTDNGGTTISAATITWQISVSSAVTVSRGGTACAGTWDSLTAPTVCTPGPATVVQLTASAEGATSAPIKVFVHQHIERLVACPVGLSVCPSPPPPTPCLSGVSLNAVADFADYQVQAFNQNTDITATIGPINWAAANTTVATLSTTATGLLFNQVQVTAKTPGQTQFFATAGNTTSTPVTFITCPLVSIVLATATGGNSLSLPKGSASQTITATVLDLAGRELTNPPLTWSSTNPTVASVSTAGVIAGLQTGGASVTASCIPTTCNIGFPAQTVPPFYPSTGISVNVTGTPSTSTAYVASSGCWDRTAGPILGCISSIIPIPQSTNTPGAPITLPHIPTSMIMNGSGNNIYVGSCVPRTAGGLPVCNGIAVVVASSGAVTINNSVTGDVVGVSLSGIKAVVSDTSTTPNQVFLYDQPSNSGTQLILAPTDHAKSAVFSSDGFQAYITTFQCTASPCQPSNEVPGPLYVFDAVNGLRLLSTPAGVTDVAFHPSGAFAYMAQGASTVTVLNTSNNNVAKDPGGAQQIKPTPGAPQFIRAVGDWDGLTHTTRFIALNGPNATGLEIITATTPAIPGDPICPLVNSPQLTICNTVGPLVDLNQGPIAATQFLLSTDGSTAYVVPQNFSSVFSYNTLTGGESGIALVGAQSPTTGGLTSDGALIYVGSTDGLLHALNTSTLIDQQQIVPVSGSTTPPTNMCSIPSATQPCNPDFVLVKP